MDAVKNGWFTEDSALWPGHCFSLKVEEVLHREKSAYQDILVIKTKTHGRALILDGIIQCTENDEFSYQEMISFLPLCAHREPKKVLIVGGGDGGVAREVSKHPLVKEIVQVEIDERVIEVSKKYLPFMAVGFESPKLQLNICDGFHYMKTHANEFDVIITDSSDPIGPAAHLFTASYFDLLKRALKPNGVVCSQAGTVWEDVRVVKKMLDDCRQHFDVVKYAIAAVPTYPTGQIGFLLATCDKSNGLNEPKSVFQEKDVGSLNLRYYNGEVHKASFVLPSFCASGFYK